MSIGHPPMAYDDDYYFCSKNIKVFSSLNAFSYQINREEMCRYIKSLQIVPLQIPCIGHSLSVCLFINFPVLQKVCYLLAESSHAFKEEIIGVKASRENLVGHQGPS